MGFNSGIRHQIRKILEEREQDPEAKTTDGKSLLVVKQDITEKAFAALGLTLNPAKAVKRKDTEFRREGILAGMEANLGRPVGQGVGLLR